VLARVCSIGYNEGVKSRISVGDLVILTMIQAVLMAAANWNPRFVPDSVGKGVVVNIAFLLAAIFPGERFSRGLARFVLLFYIALVIYDGFSLWYYGDSSALGWFAVLVAPTLLAGFLVTNPIMEPQGETAS